jgi:phosphopantetheinyl transferase
VTAGLVRVRVIRATDTADRVAPAWFNAHERQRLEAMGSAQRRAQFLAGHRLAREMAAGPEASLHAFDLVADAAGAPRLVRVDGGPGFHVSLAHSGDWVACALADAPVGIDVETEARARDLDAVATYTFAPEHAALVRRLDGADKAAAFYRYWTLAEAQGKHAGHGLRPHEVRGLAWRECAPAAAAGITWQDGEVSLAVWCTPGARIDVSGWSAPAPRYWCVEPASGSAG